jgi:hypothetical protein
MILLVLSGFLGRYLMGHIALTVREKREVLTQLELAYRETAGALAAHPEQAALVRPLASPWSRLTSWFLSAHAAEVPGTMSAPAQAIKLAASMSDLEYAIKSHETFKRWFAGWLKFHIVISVPLYVLLALHVWAGVYFGLRWLS